MCKPLITSSIIQIISILENLYLNAKRQNFIFFFFQAEDGIRDYKVTGVQTCALPISQLADEVQMARESTTAHARLNEWTARKEIGRARVGKECRSRWSPYH